MPAGVRNSNSSSVTCLPFPAPAPQACPDSTTSSPAGTPGRRQILVDVIKNAISPTPARPLHVTHVRLFVETASALPTPSANLTTSPDPLAAYPSSDITEHPKAGRRILSLPPKLSKQYAPPAPMQVSRGMGPYNRQKIQGNRSGARRCGNIILASATW